MHIFISLGMLAPFFIGRWLRSRDLSFAPRGAKRGTAAVTLGLLAASAGLYFAASVTVPALLSAYFAPAVVSDVLLWIQVVKGALFAAMFAWDVGPLLRGKPIHGFTPAFTAIFLSSAVAFTVWGFAQAALTAAGPIREQYLIHGLRNLIEAFGAGLSLLALRRAARR